MPIPMAVLRTRRYIRIGQLLSSLRMKARLRIGTTLRVLQVDYQNQLPKAIELQWVFYHVLMAEALQRSRQLRCTTVV